VEVFQIQKEYAFAKDATPIEASTTNYIAGNWLLIITCRRVALTQRRNIRF